MNLSDIRAHGWRVLKVPTLLGPLWPGSGLFLHWGAGATWVVIPPDEGGIPVQKFPGRNAALRWASAQLSPASVKEPA